MRGGGEGGGGRGGGVREISGHKFRKKQRIIIVFGFLSKWPQNMTTLHKKMDKSQFRDGDIYDWCVDDEASQPLRI